MEKAHIEKITDELELKRHQVAAVAELLDQDATVPFIARYRKEATGSLDEVAVTAMRDRLEQLEELDARKAAILKSLEEQGNFTDELKAAVDAAETMATWRISTCPINRNAGPGPRLPGKRAWSRWPN